MTSELLIWPQIALSCPLTSRKKSRAARRRTRPNQGGASSNADGGLALRGRAQPGRPGHTGAAQQPQCSVKMSLANNPVGIFLNKILYVSNDQLRRIIFLEIIERGPV